MATARSSPHWHNIPHDSGFRPRKDWTLKWWMALAVILSFVFHAIMVWVFENVELPKSEPQVQSRIMHDRLKIDAELLKQQQAIRDIPQDLAAVEKPSLDKFQPNADDYDKASLIPKDVQINLTPNVKEIQNIVRATNASNTQGNAVSASAQALANMLAAPTQIGPSDADIASAMSAMKSSVLSRPLSSKQMVLDATLATKGNSKIGMELLNSIGEGKGRAASNVKVDGYSSLDDILSDGGKVGGSTGPILMPTDLLFEFGSDQLAEGARLSLMKLGFLIQKNPSSLFIIEGHTDTIGSEESNFELSQRRAQAVVQWLQTSLQLNDERIRAVGLGESRPLEDPTGSKEQQSLNRRVEIKVRSPGEF
jgi:outer membrane protein OmpA-like peptidoglycan-associated protein